MLGKLLKHEFRATGRLMWVIYVAMVLLSFGGYVGLNVLDNTNNSVLTAIQAMLMILWILSLVVGVCLTVGLLVHRFYKNLLTDEGYLMFTLPASVHQLVLAKVLVAAVWLIATIAVVILCVLIGTYQNSFIGNFQLILNTMTARLALDTATMFLELLLVLFLGCAVSCLQFYSAMSIGYGFVNHKALWSVVFYFVIMTAVQLLSSILLGTGMVHMAEAGAAMQALTPMQEWHLSILSGVVLELIGGAIFYCITIWNLKKRLNLA